MIKKLPLFLGMLCLSITSFSQENLENIYWYTSLDTEGYISFQKLDSNNQNTINTVVKANFDSEVLNFSLSTSCESEKMVIAKEFKFHGTIDSNIEPVNFTGTKIKTDKNDISFWHFKGDYVDEIDSDPDVQRFTFAKYNATLKIPARTIPTFNLWAIIPKLPFDRRGTFKFNALDETKLYVLKNHTVNYLGTTTTKINGKDMKLHKFVHQGKGMKDAYYWVSEERELMQVFLDDKYTFTLSSKEAALQTAMLSKSEE
ncbi:hypothetical protein JBL43_14355 [Aureibaculum sp. A20]|uniref:DUF3108 domain-containing protein n=1 Tax=Aureibaculum flavum TaxID=2795986 RepID=A0ABS0WTY0_9FLAO|nr:hypothetical protein [Aureibaculum flavum]MBJ2175430.1 hypothetical protein [Aureibaculum flavum]